MKKLILFLTCFLSMATAQAQSCGTLLQAPCAIPYSNCPSNPFWTEPCQSFSFRLTCGSNLQLDSSNHHCVPNNWARTSVVGGMQAWDSSFGLPTSGINLNFVTELKAGAALPSDGLYIFVFRAVDSKLLVRISDRPADSGTYFKGNTACSFPGNPNANGESPHMFVRHTQLNGGYTDVWSAGQLEIYAGRIVWVSNASGHFAPSFDSLSYVVSTLVAMNLAPANTISMYRNGWTPPRMSTMPVIAFNTCSNVM
jgi:hypothetical protein